jgi:hypothetical protein
MIIGLCGYAQSGKDTAADLLAQYGFERRAFADALREVVYRIDPLIPIPADSLDGTYRLQHIVDGWGWDFAKTAYPEVRRLLQVTGTEAVRQVLGESIWVDHIMDGIVGDENIVITDVRYPDEVAAVKEAGGIVVWIHRDGVGPVNSHASDNALSAENADYILFNPGDIDGYLTEVGMLVEAYDLVSA